MKNVLMTVLYIVIGLLVGGVVFLVSGLPRGEPVTLRPPPTSAPISVHIIGEINAPGIYQLSPGSRVQDVVEAAEGFSENADDQGVNLAALLEDGQQIRIPTLLSTVLTNGNSNQSGTSGVSPASPGFLININTASQEDLETLPGIGPSIAEAIINYRKAQGEFKSVDEIQKVPGIGPEKYENIKYLITVDPP